MKRRILKKGVRFLFVFLAMLIFFTTSYVSSQFRSVGFEQLLYTIIRSEGTSITAILEGILFVSIATIVSIVFVYIFAKKTKKYFQNELYFKLSIKNKDFKFKILPISLNKSLVISFLFFVFTVLMGLHIIDFFDYVSKVLNKTTLYEEKYVEPRDVKINFPKNKQNLIYIFVESLEATSISKENGGAFDETVISELEDLALDNISFSNSDKLGGAYALDGNSWTIAAMIGQTSGIPFRVPLSVANDYSGYGESVPGAYSIGEILADNGYKNYLMLGSDANFGGRKDYFTYHGNYEIYDYYYALENEWIPSDYLEWWGFEDKKLFEFAKEKLLEISENDEPFNFTMLTADTHFGDGYQDETCDVNFESKYANSFDCSSKMIYEFIKWIKKQDFYKNTTIVIVGDHLTMQEDFYSEIDDDYQRGVYNVFINSKNKNTDYLKNREFTTMDMYPTTLAALGCEIEGDRLALGTNLFSGKKTLAEQLGKDELNNELQMSSFFYDETILGDSYYKIKEND